MLPVIQRVLNTGESREKLELLWLLGCIVVTNTDRGLSVISKLYPRGAGKLVYADPKNRGLSQNFTKTLNGANVFSF